MPFIRDVSANYHSDKPSECYARRYTCMIHVGTYIALRPHRGFRVMDPQYRDILELHCIQFLQTSFFICDYSYMTYSNMTDIASEREMCRVGMACPETPVMRLLI